MRGNITRRGKSSWQLKLDVGIDETGEQAAIRYVTFRGKRADAEAELVRLLNNANRGTLIDPNKVTWPRLSPVLARFQDGHHERHSRAIYGDHPESDQPDPWRD